MELLDHIGTTAPLPLTTYEIWVRFKGYVSLLALLALLWQYLKLSVICSVVALLVPQTSESIKRLASFLFWNLCLHLMHANGVEFAISGDELEPESSLVLANHRSLADYVVMAYLAKISVKDKTDNQSGLSSDLLLWTPRVNFFSWFFVWRMPSLRILFNMMKCDENWELEPSLNASRLSGVFQKKSLEWIVLFPEINIFTQSSHFLQNQHSEKYFLPIFDCLLYPRFSPLYNVVQYMHWSGNFKFTKLYDLTISYHKSPRLEDNFASQSPVTLMDIFSSSQKIIVHVHVKTRMITGIPLKRKKLEKWLEKVWQEKNKTLQKLERTKFETANFEKQALQLATPSQLASPMVSLCNDIENLLLAPDPSS